MDNRRLFSRLEAEIGAESWPRNDCLRAERIGYLARCGLLDDARVELAALRSRYEHIAHKEVTPWINFADAMVDRAAGAQSSAFMKMRRAHAISRATDVRPIRVLAAAWLAHLYWDLQELAPTIEYMKEAIDLLRPEDMAARIRLSLELGGALIMSGREADGRSCFLGARAMAQGIGDDPSLSALNFNIAAATAMALRKRVLFEQIPMPQDVPFEAYLSENFDTAMGIRVDAHTPMQQAVFASLCGNPRKALELFFDNHSRDSALFQAARQESDWMSDEAWCLARLGQPQAARDAAVIAEQGIEPETQLDDRAATHSRLALVYEALGDAASAAQHRNAGDLLWEEYGQFQEECAREFGKLDLQLLKNP